METPTNTPTSKCECEKPTIHAQCHKYNIPCDYKITDCHDCGLTIAESTPTTDSKNSILREIAQEAMMEEAIASAIMNSSEDWEKEFDDEFLRPNGMWKDSYVYRDGGQIHSAATKDFIRREIQQAEQEAYERGWKAGYAEGRNDGQKLMDERNELDSQLAALNERTD